MYCVNNRTEYMPYRPLLRMRTACKLQLTLTCLLRK